MTHICINVKGRRVKIARGSAIRWWKICRLEEQKCELVRRYRTSEKRISQRGRQFCVKIPLGQLGVVTKTSSRREAFQTSETINSLTSFESLDTLWVEFVLSTWEDNVWEGFQKMKISRIEVGTWKKFEVFAMIGSNLLKKLCKKCYFNRVHDDNEWDITKLLTRVEEVRWSARWCKITYCRICWSIFRLRGNLLSGIASSCRNRES